VSEEECRSIKKLTNGDDDGDDEKGEEVGTW
jgi:hypothetical protein